MAYVFSQARVLSPAETPIFRDIAILRTSCFILRLRPCPLLIPSLPKPSFKFRRFYPLAPKSRALPPHTYEYPDPIPEFAVAETEKFRAEIRKKMSKDEDAFGDDLNVVIEVCAQILSDFLHKEYGGPGTLLVDPFTDMFVVLKEKRLPGATTAARASLLWAQNFIDQDYEVWITNKAK